MEMFYLHIEFILPWSHIAHCSNASYYIRFYNVIDLDHIGLMSHMSHIAHLISYCI